HAQPLSLLQVGHRFEGIAGESREAAAEANYDQQSPARVDKHALGGPDHEPADDKAAGEIDDQSSVRKHWTENFGDVTAENVAEIGADDGAQRYHDEVHPESSQESW